MELANGWTGSTASALQAALRMSNEAFAEHLGIGVRTVAGWHQKPTLRPKTEMQQLLDTALEQAGPVVQQRFAALTAPSTREPTQADHRLSTDPHIGAALDWLDHHAGWEPGTARAEVSTRLAQLDPRALQDRASRRSRIDQHQVARALSEYYPSANIAPFGRYQATSDNHEAVTTILTRPEWLDLNSDLAADGITLASATPEPIRLDEQAAGHAAQRLAETLAMGTRLVEMPLYQLLSTDIQPGSIAGTVGVTHFVRYALTMDLLEGELIDALVANVDPNPGSLPLRDRYLPDLQSVLDLSSRLCSGGVLALCAIARPALYGREADYVLLVQERSGNVLNAAKRLAVIPKGFHQPIADYRADAHVGATLRREMEEELFGREDIDNTLNDQRSADPMHPSRLSEPMRWLTEQPGRLKIECTAFGLNLVSGNFEFPSLIVIDDEEFWTRYGGQIEANWESANLRQYSSLDRELLTELIGDAAWSNEGLFALLQGLRRLAQIGGARVDLPEIRWELGQ